MITTQQLSNLIGTCNKNIQNNLILLVEILRAVIEILVASYFSNDKKFIQLWYCLIEYLYIELKTFDKRKRFHDLRLTLSFAGNLLINVGPTKDGIIAPIFQERLLDMGKWLAINGEAIYSSKPWIAQNDSLTSDVWYTSDASKNVYAIALQWPSNNILYLKSAYSAFTSPATTVELLGNKGYLKVRIYFLSSAQIDSSFLFIMTMLEQQEV